MIAVTDDQTRLEPCNTKRDGRRSLFVPARPRAGGCFGDVELGPLWDERLTERDRHLRQDRSGRWVGPCRAGLRAGEPRRLQGIARRYGARLIAGATVIADGASEV
jgi:hypothetical protein